VAVFRKPIDVIVLPDKIISDTGMVQKKHAAFSSMLLYFGTC